MLSTRAVLFLCILSATAMVCYTDAPYAETKKVTLRLHCWHGYAKPYAEEFQNLVKSKHNVDVELRITNVSNPCEFWEFARGRKADLISPAHNILMGPTWNFVKGGIAVPIDRTNIPNYRHILPVLQSSDFATQNGELFGVPYTMGAYGLAYNAEKVKPPESWNVLWEEKSKGRYTVSKDYADCNVYIAALALGAGYSTIYDIDKLLTVPAVGIDRLTLSHLKASRLQEKLNALAQNAYSLWEGTADPDEFDQLAYAVSWGYALQQANRKGLNWVMAKPKEGSVVWVDHWVVTYAVNPDSLKKRLCEEWINHCLGREMQIRMVRNWGASPVVTNISASLTEEEVRTFHVGDNDYWETLSFWEYQSKRTTNAYCALWKNALASRPANPVK